MMEVITDISNCIGEDTEYAKAKIDRCSEHGCKLVLDSLPHRIIFKGEKLVQTRKICDCIIFAIYEGLKGNLIVGIVELKSKTVDTNNVVQKLTNGSQVAMNILSKCKMVREKLKFYPIVLAKRWKPSELKTLKKRKIPIADRKYNIIHEKCSRRFREIIQKYR